MSATAIFVTAIIGAGILVAAGVFTVAWRRGPSAGPVVGEFDKDAVKRDISRRSEPEAPTAVAEIAEPEPPPSIEDNRKPVSAEDLGETRRMPGVA